MKQRLLDKRLENFLLASMHLKERREGQRERGREERKREKGRREGS